jgi:glycosyltransferase involved in cell wall biosynthesis
MNDGSSEDMIVAQDGREAASGSASGSARRARTCNIGFVLEQALGHITHTKNLQAHVQNDPEVSPSWALIDFKAEGIGARIPVFRSNWSVRAGIRANRQLAAIARTTRLDVLFFHTQVPAVLAQRWMHRIPSIVSLDATPLQYDALGAFYQHEAGPRWLETIKWRLNRDCYRAARQIVVWAEWTQRGLVADYEVPDDKITVIPPGVIVRDWERKDQRRAESSMVRILFVGGDLRRKGGHLLLKAFRELRTPSLELHLVTKDAVPPEPGLFVYNDMQPNSAELKALYHRCDIFALPTSGDCLPMVLSEAGAAGLAVVSTDVAGIPEIVRHEQTGLTVPAGDGNALTAALRPLIADPQLRLDLGARAHRHVSRYYDADKNSTRLLSLLKAEARTSVGGRDSKSSAHERR